jgi:hypothetical protein
MSLAFVKAYSTLACIVMTLLLFMHVAAGPGGLLGLGSWHSSSMCLMVNMILGCWLLMVVGCVLTHFCIE